MPKFQKVTLNQTNVNIYIDILKKMKQPFTIEISNYTTKIISKSYNIHFLKTEQSNRVFAAAAKIKNDLKGIEIPDLDMSRNKYYDTCFKGSGFYTDKVWNIDIKSAYSSILKNAGYISEETSLYIEKLPKLERLAALGMLASKKEIYVHSASGAVIKMEDRINPLSNFFFYCVQETEKIIQMCVNQILYDAFLFSWVDGIYYLNHNPEYHILTQQYLKREFNLDSTFQQLTNFEVTLKKEFYNISFIDQKTRPKIFNIPIPETELKKKIIAHLLNKQYDTKPNQKHKH